MCGEKSKDLRPVSETNMLCLCCLACDAAAPATRKTTVSIARPGIQNDGARTNQSVLSGCNAAAPTARKTTVSIARPGIQNDGARTN